MAAVRRYNILDTPPDGAFDRITRIAARLFGVPIAIVSIVDHDRIWFKSHHGLDVAEIPRSPGLCASAILDSQPWVLSDAKVDPRSLANPLVAGEFGLRFYAGVPLRTFDGFNLGTLCVIDKAPREVDDDELANLQDLAAIVMDEIELRRSARTAVEEKEVLFREVHHRVKNNLQIVSSLITLQNRHMPPDSRHHLEECLRRIQSMAGLHEKFYQGQQAETINLVEYLSEMSQTIIESFGLGQRVKAEAQGQPVEVDLEMGTPLALLAAEVISNACKHGFPGDRHGRIEVDVAEQGGKLHLTISDDGIGLPSDAPQKGNAGMGQRLIANFVQRLEGTSSFTSADGTRFEMTCPLIHTVVKPQP
jgi:two-component sensor histidine kinase